MLSANTYAPLIAASRSQTIIASLIEVEIARQACSATGNYSGLKRSIGRSLSVVSVKGAMMPTLPQQPPMRCWMNLPLEDLHARLLLKNTNVPRDLEPAKWSGGDLSMKAEGCELT